MAAVVIDIGTAYMRVGFAGEGKPRHVLRLPETAKANEALAAWLADCYLRLLEVNNDRTVFVAEDVYGTTLVHEAFVEAFERRLAVTSLRFLPSTAAAVFASGVQTGLALDVGRAEARVLALVDGRVLWASLRAAPLGMQAVLDSAQSLFGLDASATHAEEVVTRAGFVLPRRGKAAAAGDATVRVATADGQPLAVTVPEAARSGMFEVLFRGDDEGFHLAALVFDALRSCPIDARVAIASNLVLAGGVAMMPGFGDRVEHELIRSRPDDLASIAFTRRPSAFAASLVPWVGATVASAYI